MLLQDLEQVITAVEVSEKIQKLIEESTHYNKALMYVVARTQSISNKNMSEEQLSCHIENIYKQNNWIDSSRSTPVNCN